MDQKDLDNLQLEIKAEQKKQTDAIEALKKASSDQKVELEGKIEESEKKIGTLEKDKETLSKQLDTIQLEMKDTKFGTKGTDSFMEMKKSWDKKDFIEGMKSNHSKFDQTFEIKAVIDTATYLSGSALATAVVLPMREPGIGKAPDRIPMLLDLVSRGNTNSDTITWVERSARTAAAAAVAEGAAYAQSDMTYIQRSLPVERKGHYIKVQNKSLDDWDYLLSEINLELFTGLERILEEGVYSGTGVTPQILGITAAGVAQAYAVAALAGTIITPNHFDVLRAAYAQLVTLHYMPTAILINPVDGAAMDMPKNVDGIYLLPPFITADRTRVKGIPVYESTLVTAGSFLIGDFSKDALFMRKGIEIRIWEQNENDVLYDRKTITASLRACNRIKQPDYYAFVADTFANGITALTV
jgi:HK97 family phage major capsid protein